MTTWAIVYSLESKFLSRNESRKDENLQFIIHSHFVHSHSYGRLFTFYLVFLCCCSAKCRRFKGDFMIIVLSRHCHHRNNNNHRTAVIRRSLENSVKRERRRAYHARIVIASCYVIMWGKETRRTHKHYPCRNHIYFRTNRRWYMETIWQRRQPKQQRSHWMWS